MVNRIIRDFAVCHDSINSFGYKVTGDGYNVLTVVIYNQITRQWHQNRQHYS
ncbi:hypothetical protein SAMN05444266_105254 [Chitinophaga jiangningensis]|uniref:Uncharacterized protein n=1 Tax=Chitinophaga jiangningensis TaxID=1419482 RepID=A0A1M7E3X9_9BACT|nr:hypothetical protein SAMN05444266_105254 [Chitinophaga jiangningensis]